MVPWLLCAMISISAQEKPAADLSAATLPDQPTVRVVVPAGRAEAVESDVVEIKLPKELMDFVGPKGFDWDPRPAPAPSRASSRASPTTETITIREAGRTPPGAVEVAFDNPRIRPGQPGLLRLRVPDPHGLRSSMHAGVFAGRLVVKLYHGQIHEGKEPIRVPIPIELIVPGRRVVGLDFLDRRPGAYPLRVGRPASVEVRVETVGSDLGMGTLDLQSAPGASTDFRTLVKIPLPLPPADGALGSPP